MNYYFAFIQHPSLKLALSFSQDVKREAIPMSF